MKSQGLTEEGSKARAVREMFGAIARRYDFLNHFLSVNIDKHWRHVCLREVERRLLRDAPAILDVGCGTADLALEFSDLGSVVGCDFCHPMLQIGIDKIHREVRKHRINLLEADALALPFPNSSFDVVVSAFVLRNLVDIDSGLREMRRVLRPGGVLGVLDFSMPAAPLLGSLYKVYFTRVLPGLGRLISGVKGAYRYLPDSVREFPPPEELIRRLESAGFDRVSYRSLTSGIAVLLVGEVEAHRS